MTVVSPMISLPNSQSAAALPTSQPIQRQYATLPRKGNNSVAIGGTLGRSPAPIPPRRDPKTTLSVGRARARSMVAGLGNHRSISAEIINASFLVTLCIIFTRFSQREAARETIAMKLLLPAQSPAVRNLFTCRSSHQLDRIPVRTHRFNQERPVFDLVPHRAGSLPQNLK